LTGWQLAAQVECRKRPGLQQQVANNSFQLVRLVGCGLNRKTQYKLGVYVL